MRAYTYCAEPDAPKDVKIRFGMGLDSVGGEKFLRGIPFEASDHLSLANPNCGDTTHVWFESLMTVEFGAGVPVNQILHTGLFQED